MKPAHRSQRGFTLLEVLISLLILLIGLLGIAVLMLKGQRASFEGYQRQQALAMAQEMAEKIRSNQRVAATSYVTGTSPTALADRIAAPFCPDSKCSMARDDLIRWDRVLVGTSETKDTAGNRVGGIIGARGCIEQPDAAQPVFWVSVAWQGEGDTGAPAATASACGAGLYGTAARRRLVTLSVATCLPGGSGC